MQRRKFIKAGCIACITGFALTEIMESCTASKHSIGTISGSDLVVPISDFHQTTGDGSRFKKYLIIQNDKLKYPICVYRLNENSYSALWMMCTHQGAELQVFGDKLQCPAHGSEFSNTGEVMGPPASQNLKTFPVIIEKDQIKISLK